MELKNLKFGIKEVVYIKFDGKFNFNNFWREIELKNLNLKWIKLALNLLLKINWLLVVKIVLKYIFKNKKDQNYN